MWSDLNKTKMSKSYPGSILEVNFFKQQVQFLENSFLYDARVTRSVLKVNIFNAEVSVFYAVILRLKTGAYIFILKNM